MNKALIVLSVLSIQAFGFGGGDDVDYGPETQVVCGASDYGIYKTTGKIESTEFRYSTGMGGHALQQGQYKVEVGGLTATVRHFFEVNGNLRFVMDLRGKLSNGEVAYSNVALTGPIPAAATLTVTVPEKDYVVGSMSCHRQ